MIKEVNVRLTWNFEKVRTRVGDFMGGKVLDWDIFHAHEEGLAEGREEGLAEGKLSILYSLVRDDLLSVKDAAAKAGMTEVVFTRNMNQAQP